MTATRALSYPVPDGAGAEKRATLAAVALVYAGVLYNTLLAVLDAAGFPQSFGSVAIVEACILGAAALRLFTLPAAAGDAMPVFLLYVGLLIASYVSLVNGKPSIECARNFTIVGLYMMIGARFGEGQLHALFRALSLIVLAFLLLEIVDTKSYVKLFQPALYYANTRGVQLFSLDSSGLFRGALGFKGRFSFGLSDHRTSSIFIEQVSLANYAAVTSIFLVTRFAALSRGDRALHLALVALILLSNDSRTSLSLTAVCAVGYWAFPRVPAGASLAIMPLVLAAGVLLTQVAGYSQGDDLRGRISVTVEHLSQFDLGTLAGVDIDTITAQMDSGYSYLIASSSLLGFAVFWLFCGLVVPQRTAAQRRCLLATNLYIFMNLMIGGTAIFSIKVAAPLWVLVGFMRSAAPPAEPLRASAIGSG